MHWSYHDPKSDGDAEKLVAGYYLHARRGCVSMPVRVWYGPPADNDGVPLDRASRWQISIAGNRYDDERDGGRAEETAKLEDVWPKALKWPIDRAEYEYRIARIEHAVDHDAGSAFAHKRGRIDLDTQAPPF